MAKSKNFAADLRKSYVEEHWAPTVRFIDWAKSNETTPDDTKTSELIDELQLRPSDAKILFKGITDLELADFIVGRRGHDSRLRWRVTLKSIADVAMGSTDAFEPLSRSMLANKNTPILEHVIHLKKDRKVVLQLPEDFSAAEAKWLATIIQNLPVQSGEEG
jgi:hypothetical protein